VTVGDPVCRIGLVFRFGLLETLRRLTRKPHRRWRPSSPAAFTGSRSSR